MEVLELEPDAQLRGWLEMYAQLQGVGGAALFLQEGRMAVGERGTFTPVFNRAVRALARDLSQLGANLELGQTAVYTLEMPGQTVIAAWPDEHTYLALIVRTPAMLNPTLKKLRGELPGLRDLLHSLHGATQPGSGPTHA